MTRGFSQALVVAALLSLGSRATSAQLACQFSRTLLLSSLLPDTAPAAPRLSVAVNAAYSFNLNPQNRAGAGDVTYRVAPQIHVAGGVAYCDTRLGIPKRPIFGLTGSWMRRLGDDWLLAAQVGASYVNLELAAGAHQKETVIPGVVVFGYSYDRLIAYAGGLVQYRHGVSGRLERIEGRDRGAGGPPAQAGNAASRRRRVQPRAIRRSQWSGGAH
jgi:hypothetical protein